MEFHRTEPQPYPARRELGIGTLLLLGLLCFATGVAWMAVTLSI